MKKITIVLLTSGVLLTACGDKSIITPTSGAISETVKEEPVNAKAKVAPSYDMELDFQGKYIPIVEAVMEKLFPSNNPAVNEFDIFGTYYIDSSGKKVLSEMKFVFLIDDMDAPKIQTLKKDLKAQMGEHVVFRQSKHTQAELRTVQDKILKELEVRRPIGGYSVGIDTMAEKVSIQALLDESRQRELIDTYGADWLDIELNEVRDDLIGYVVDVDKKEGRILVVDPTLRKKAPHFYAANWYSNAPADILIGQRVAVSIVNGPKMAMLQYPDVDTAFDVKVLPSTTAEGSILSEAEAIRRALSSPSAPSKPENSSNRVPVVKEAQFHGATSMWTVQLTDSESNKILTIEVSDK